MDVTQRVIFCNNMVRRGAETLRVVDNGHPEQILRFLKDDLTM